MNRLLPTLLLLLFISVTANAQTLRGRVLQREGRDTIPVIGATIHWLGTTQSAASDIHGNFTIKRPATGGERLIVSFVGLRSDTIAVRGSGALTIVLETEGVELGSVVVTNNRSNVVSNSYADKREVITFAGLTKMACCNLAESFENSASVTVAYSDAVSGAKQISLLGLAGVYTQMLDESRTIMRILAAPYGLSYTPGMWLSSIQLSKGISSVINGPEAFAGQINLEFRKPTDNTPLFVNGYVDQDLRSELNVAAARKISENLSTIILAHGSINDMKVDENGDHFLDLPTTRQVNLSNRWLWSTPGGAQIRVGVSGLMERRRGGDMRFDYAQSPTKQNYYGSNIENTLLGAYLKAGIPVGRERTFTSETDTGCDTATVRNNLGIVLDYNYIKVDSYFGHKTHYGRQSSVNSNVIYEMHPSLRDKLSVGASGTFDILTERVFDNHTLDFSRYEARIGAFGEYTFNQGGRVSFIVGIRGDWSNLFGFYVTPRSNLKIEITDNLTFRASAGRGLRTANPISDNIFVLATGRQIVVKDFLTQDKGWTYGGSLTQYFGKAKRDYVSIDLFRSEFSNQLIADFEQNTTQTILYNVPYSNSNTIQIDFSAEPFERFTVFASARFNRHNVELEKWGLTSKPLNSSYKALINIQYALPLNKWVFDFTAQLNGASRLPMLTGGDVMRMEYSPAFPVYFAQITKRFRFVDVYLGCENIANFKQHNPIISPDNPFSPEFNSAIVWGPIMGRKLYGGFRFNL